VSDADIDEPSTSSPVDVEDVGKGGADGRDGGGRSSGSVRRPALAAVCAIAVLALTGVGVGVWPIPVHHATVTKVDKTRLAQLAIQTSGLPGYKSKPTTSGSQTDTGTGLAGLTAAAKKSPNETGLYSIEWESSAKGSTNLAGVVVFLLPTPEQAQTVMGQVAKTVLGAAAESANKLDRVGTFSIPGIPESDGSAYRPSKPSKTSQDLAVTLFRSGRAVALVQQSVTTETAAGLAETKANAITVSHSQYKTLTKNEPGFTMVDIVRPAYTTRPVVATAVWIVVGVVLALMVGLGPWYIGRSRRRRMERLEAERQRLIVVRGQTIAKRRR
jgi:hypothetical protein